jgi:glycosyltransferase involved in cell wall biosynthesis
LRILHVVYVYPPKSKVADGITNVAFMVTQELARRGDEVVVYTSDMLDLHGNSSIKPESKMINGVKVYYLKSFWRFKTLIVTPSILPLLYRDIGKFDIIHVHDCRSFQGICTYFFAKVKKVPYVFQPHGSYLFSLNDSIPKHIAKVVLDKLVSNRVVQGSSKIIALNEAEADQCRSAGIPKEKIAIIPNGIDLSKYNNLPLKGAFKKRFNMCDDKIVLFLGRIHKIKGIDILVRAFAEVVKKDASVKLVIVGPDDGFLNEVNSLINSLGITDKVLIVGPLYGEEKFEAYADADVFVLPSIYDTFPMSVLEAAASGIPIILSASCGIAEYFIDDCMCVVVNPNPKALEEAVLNVLGGGKVCKPLDRNHSSVLKAFDISLVSQKLEDIYRSSINS